MRTQEPRWSKGEVTAVRCVTTVLCCNALYSSPRRFVAWTRFGQGRSISGLEMVVLGQRTHFVSGEEMIVM